MVNPPPWDKLIYTRRHHVENAFSRLKDWSCIALRRDETRQSWTGFAHLAATLINRPSTSLATQPRPARTLWLQDTTASLRSGGTVTPSGIWAQIRPSSFAKPSSFGVWLAAEAEAEIRSLNPSKRKEVGNNT